MLRSLSRKLALVLLGVVVLLPSFAQPVAADALDDARAFRTAVRRHGGAADAWLESYIEAVLGSNWRNRSLAHARGLAEIAAARSDAELEQVVRRRGGEVFDRVLEVASGNATGWRAGEPLPQEAVERVTAVISPVGEGRTPFRIENLEPPARFRTWLHNEQKVNDKVNNLEVFASLEQNDVPRELDPVNGRAFWLPMVEIPLEEASVVRAPGEQHTTEQVIIERGGKKYVRFFIHPAAEGYYGKLIRDYGVKREFMATPTSSPRSLFVWNPRAPSAEPFIVKTSLPLEVGEARRMVPKDKIIRGVGNSASISEAFARGQISNNTLFMPEQLGVMPPGFESGQIVRSIPRELGESKWVPGFSLVGHDGSKPTSMLVDMIRQSGMDPHEFVNKKIVEPMLRAYAELSLGQGLVGEPHQQNLLFEIGRNGLPTGRVMFRDLDSYKVDVELRARRGLSMRALTEAMRPTKMFKTAKGNDYYKDSYETYIKQDIGYMIQKELRKYWPRFSRDRLYADMDRAMAREVTRHLGVEVPAGEMAEFDLAEQVKEWKRRALEQSPSRQNLSASQQTLRAEFDRGVFNYRVMWLDRALARRGGQVRYLLHDGVVEMQVNGRPVGFTFLEPPTAGRDFYRGVPYPRRAPPEGRLAQLYASFNRLRNAQVQTALLDLIRTGTRPTPEMGRAARGSAFGVLDALRDTETGRRLRDARARTRGRTRGR